MAWVVLAGGLVAAEDWPEWRGPRRDGTASAFAERKAWPASLKKVWTVTAGLGHSSPVVVGGRAFLHAREGEEEVVTAYDLATGRRLWRQAYAAPYTMNPAAAGHGPGPKSTPVARGGRLFTFGISGILSSFDMATGQVLRRRDFRREFKETSPSFGTALSPVVEDGLLIAHVGGHDDGALTAFDAATGAARWAWKGDGPAYASPVIATLGGVRQVVTQTQGRLVGLSLDRGELLWSLPFTTPYVQNAVTPVIRGQTVIYSGLDNGVQAVKVEKGPGGWVTRKEWENQDASFYMSTPVLVADVLYGFSHRRKGQLVALDAQSGRTLWTGPGRQGENASLVAAGGALLVLTNEGELTVARPDPAKLAPLASYTVASGEVWAHPAVTPDGILIKEAEALTLWRPE